MRETSGIRHIKMGKNPLSGGDEKCDEYKEESVVELRASVADPPEFTRILALALSKVVDRLHMRVGLVPNYFMTRGEATLPQDTFRSLSAFGRKTAATIFRLFHQKDFREERLCTEFDHVMEIVQTFATQRDEVSTDAVAEILNRQTGKDGDSLLQILIKRRHLRLFRLLLLHASELLDLDQRNRKGYSALDLACDRLEVEMVYLLLLHGANTGIRKNERSSLGYGEWIGYDMLLNLDTGRWIHKQSELAIIEHVKASMTPSLQMALMQWTKGSVMSRSTLGSLGCMPRLFTIVLADGCDAITNHEAWATMIRHLAFLRGNNLCKESEVIPKSIDTTYTVEAVVCGNLCDFLRDNEVDASSFTVAGRTLFFQSRDGNEEIAVKFSKSLEDCKAPHPLVKEAAMNCKIAELKKNYSLQSDFPVNVQLLKLSNVPEAMRAAIKNQQATGYHPFKLSSDDSGVMALVYRPPKGYTHYANDPSLSLEACRSGIAKACYDSAVLARHGLYHGALVDIQHDSSREQRPHLWSFESFLTRFRSGAGRIEKGYHGLGSPNVRASGLADLKHIINADQVQTRYDPSVIHAQHNILYNDQERLQVELIEQLGASLFAAALLVASSYQSRHAQGISESENLDLSRELLTCFSTFLQGYLQIDADKAQQFLNLINADFDLMAAQIRLFSTLQYVKIAETAPRRPTFGFLAKLLGWWTHPTAMVHFAQQGGGSLTGWRSLPAIRNVYVPIAATKSSVPPGYPRVDTSMMRCSPTWVSGQGWVNSQGQAHLGSYEGVLPFQQLIRDLYATVLLAWLIRHHLPVGDGGDSVPMLLLDG